MVSIYSSENADASIVSVRLPAHGSPITSSTRRIIRTTCVANRNCCRFEINGSYTCCAFMSPVSSVQSLQPTILISAHAVDTEAGILLSHLTGLYIGKGIDRG